METLKLGDDPIGCNIKLQDGDTTFENAVLRTRIKPLSFGGLGPTKMAHFERLPADKKINRYRLLVEKEITHLQFPHIEKAFNLFEMMQEDTSADSGDINKWKGTWEAIKEHLQMASDIAEKERSPLPTNNSRDKHHKPEPNHKPYYDLPIGSYLTGELGQGDVEQTEQGLQTPIPVTFEGLKVSKGRKSPLRTTIQAPMTVGQWAELDSGLKAYADLSEDPEMQDKINESVMSSGSQIFKLFCAANNMTFLIENESPEKAKKHHKEFMEKNIHWVEQGTFCYDITESLTQNILEHLKGRLSKETQKVKDVASQGR